MLPSPLTMQTWTVFSAIKRRLGSTPKIDTKPSINLIFGASTVAHFFLSFTRFPVVLVPIAPDNNQDRAFPLYTHILGN